MHMQTSIATDSIKNKLKEKKEKKRKADSLLQCHVNKIDLININVLFDVRNKELRQKSFIRFLTFKGTLLVKIILISQSEFT